MYQARWWVWISFSHLHVHQERHHIQRSLEQPSRKGWGQAADMCLSGQAGGGEGRLLTCAAAVPKNRCWSAWQRSQRAGWAMAWRCSWFVLH